MSHEEALTPWTQIIETVYEGERGYARGPERMLLAALLFDGIQGYIQYAVSSNASTKKKHHECYRWIFEGGDDYVFSFNSVCDALGVNSEYLRLGLVNSSTSLLAEFGKSRRTF